MEKSERAKTRKEWACRILLTLHFWYCVSGYVSYVQAKHTLITPLIPQSTILNIIDANFLTSLVTSGVFILTLWMYFLKKPILVIIFSSVSILLTGFFYAYFSKFQ
jgi:hypothetical protein